MCGRFAQYRIPWEYLEPLGLDVPMAGFVDPEPVNRYNVAPRSKVHILHLDPVGLRWDLVRWGVEPFVIGPHQKFVGTYDSDYSFRR